MLNFHLICTFFDTVVHRIRSKQLSNLIRGILLLFYLKSEIQNYAEINLPFYIKKLFQCKGLIFVLDILGYKLVHQTIGTLKNSNAALDDKGRV